MGEVYRARARLHRDVALKVIAESRRLHDDLRQRFEREARLLASLNHPDNPLLSLQPARAGRPPTRAAQNTNGTRNFERRLYTG